VAPSAATARQRRTAVSARPAAKSAAAAQGKKLQEPTGLARLLSTHPDNYTRLRALEPYLQLPR